MTRIRWSVALVTFACGCAARAEDAVWNGVSGNWSDATHWSSAAYPDNNDPLFYDVFIGSSTVTQDVAAGATMAGVTIDSLTWTGGILAGNQPVTVLGAIDWSNGLLSNTAGLNVAPAATLTISGTQTENRLTDDSVLSVDGVVVIEDGAKLNTAASPGNAAIVTIRPGAEFDLAGDAALSDTFFDNPDVVRAAAIENSGLFKKSSGTNTSLRNVADDWTFHNAVDGTVRVEAGTLIFSPAANGFANDGLVDVEAGLLQIGGGTSTGTFEVANGATLRVTTGSPLSLVHVFDGATINNAGTLDFPGRVQFINGSSITGILSASLSTSTAELGGTDPIALDGLSWTGGKLSNTGGVMINPGGSLAISGTGTKQLANNASLVIAGNATLAGSQSIQNLASIGAPATVHVTATGLLDVQANIGLSENPASAGTNAATLLVDGTLRKSAGTGVSAISTDWTVQNNGTIEVQSGTLRVFADVTHDGTIHLDGGAIDFRGDVGGDGAFTGAGTTTFRADYRPGASAAEILFGGDVEFLSATADLLIELGGTQRGTQYDALTIAGAATLEGSLRVSLVDVGGGLFAPAAGDTFEIISAASGITNDMTVFLPPLANADLSWEVLLSSDSSLLSLHVREESVGSGFGGDYNGNGIVDAADYTVWRDTLGQVGAGLAADGSGPMPGVPDGVVDQLDYEFWKARFGQVAPPDGGAGGHSTLGGSLGLRFTVPEPTPLALLLIAVAVHGIGWAHAALRKTPKTRRPRYCPFLSR